MQGSQYKNHYASLKNESVWFKTKLISQFLAFSFLLSNPFYISYLYAAPIGGNVVGGSGSISQSDLTTTINQNTQNLAIDWQSFDVNTNEKVNFIQPNSSSIALNRILGNNGSTIQGQINANGQVILVNPNGVLFTSTATVNAGGLIASSLDMSPTDFMNGNYIFNEVLGADGSVINSGIINASLGGNVALIGKQVKNDGLISANLGSVVLAAGKQSVLTFDNQGLIGVSVTQEVLQDELGLGAAVSNSGEIKAEGGRVLLTASTSQDVFSQAVNNSAVESATSVVVHEDGTFTLGGGADVINTGSIDVSSKTNEGNTARIILLGENVTSSGNITADTESGNAGEIELHAKDTTLLTENSYTSAQANSSGVGGVVKVLGDKVGLLDSAQVNVSGFNGGGQALFGGDYLGENSRLRNAAATYLGLNVSVFADGLNYGDGGRVIFWGNELTKAYGAINARGGLLSGNGGFVETSAKTVFLNPIVDVSAVSGNGGTWLIDPTNIEIFNDGTPSNIGGNQSADIDLSNNIFTATADNSRLDNDALRSALQSNGVTVIIETTAGGLAEGPLDTGDFFNSTGGGNIWISGELDLEPTDLHNRNTDTNRPTLELRAHHDIIVDGQIRDSNNDNDAINLKFIADYTSDGNGNGDGDVIINADINTYGGDFVAESYGGNIAINNNIDTSGLDDNISGGLIDLKATSGIISVQQLTSDGGNGSNNNIGQAAGSITLLASSDITLNDQLSAKGGDGNDNTPAGTGFNGGAGGAVSIRSSAGNIFVNNDIETTGGAGDAQGDEVVDIADGGAAGKIDLITNNATKSITLRGDLIALGGELADNSGAIDSNNGAGGKITLDGNVVLNDITDSLTTINTTVDFNNTARGAIIAGDVEFKGTVNGTAANTDNLTIYANNITFLANVGTSTTPLGNLDLNSLYDNTIPGNIDFVLRNGDLSINTRYDIHASKLDALLFGDFTSGNINARGLIPAGSPVVDAVYIDSVPGDIDISSIDSSGIAAAGDQDGFNGGNVVLVGDDISIGLINTSGSNASTVGTSNQNGGHAGYIYLSAEDKTTSTITLTGDITANGGTATGTNGVVGDSNSIDFDAYNVATVGNRIFSAIGNNVTNTGYIDFFRFNTQFFTSNLALGGDLTLNSGDGGFIQLWADVDFNNAATSFLILNSGGDIRIDGNIGDSVADAADILNITLNAANDVNIGTFTTATSIDINTGGGEFNVSAVNYNGQSDADTKKTINTINQANNTVVGTSTITTSQAVVLGEMVVGDTLDVTAGTTITQGTAGVTPDTINTKALASFKTTGSTSTDDITLTNDNVFEGNIDLATNAGGAPATNAYQSDISIKNTHIDTFINDVSVYGDLTINADNNLSLVGTITAYNNDEIATPHTPNEIILNFGQASTIAVDATGGTFTSTGASLNIDNAGGDDLTNVTIAGGLGIDTFNFNDDSGTGVVTTFTGVNNLTINGGDSNDVFNIGHVTEPTNLVNFTSIENLAINGNLGDDDFNIRNISFGSVNNLQINGNEGADDFNINSHVQGATTAVLNGNEGADFFNINATGLNVTTINGGADTAVDTINAANENNFWLIENVGNGRLFSTDPGNEVPYAIDQRVTFFDIEALNGNAANDTYIFTVDPSTSGITADGAGSTSDIVRLANNLTGVTLVAGSFTGIERYVGNTNANTLQGAAGGTNTWRIEDFDPGVSTDGVNDGKVNGIEFVNFTTLQGGASDSTDNFTFYGDARISGSTGIDGNGGTDTINGPAGVAHQWAINGPGAGSLTTTATTTFINIDNINGAEFNDTFTFNTDPSLSGITIDGAGQTTGVDSVVLGGGLSGVTLVAGSLTGIERYVGNTNANTLEGAGGGTNDWRIENFDPGVSTDGVNDGTVNGIEFINFSTLQGGTAVASNDNFTFVGDAYINGNPFGINGNGGTNSITGPTDRDNNWLITSAGTGSLTTGTSVTRFTGIDDLNGANQTDTFTFDVDPSLSGITIDGAGQTTGVDSVVLGGGLSGVTLVAGSLTGIERYVGNANANTLEGPGGGINTWRIENFDPGASTDGVNDGTVNGIEFINFSTLQGGTAVASDDNFTFIGSASVDGTTGINGNSGTNSITGPDLAINNWTITDATAGSVNGTTFTGISSLTGGINIDRFVMSNTTDFAGTINGGSGTDRLTAATRSNTWGITAANNGSVTGLANDFISFEELVGGGSDDHLTLDNTITFAGSFNGGGGTDEIISGARTGGTNWAITAANETGTVTGLSSGFSSVEILTGGTGDDNFTLHSSANFNGTITGGAGTGIDKLTGGTRSNNWAIDPTGNTVTGLSNTFSGIEQLVGGGSDDHLQLHDTINFAGTFDGAGGVDEILGGNRPNIWTISEENTAGTEVAGTVTGLSGTLTGFTTGSFKNVETLTGNANTDDYTLLTGVTFNGSIDGRGDANSLTAGNNANNTWNIVGANRGDVTGINNTSGDGFTNIQTISGGTGSDLFTFGLNGDIDGLIDGNTGAASSIDVIDVTSFTDDTRVELGTQALYEIDVLNAHNIEAINARDNVSGTDLNNIIVGANRQNTWVINGLNSGYVEETNLSDPQTTTSFTNFRTVLGNADDDVFRFVGATSDIESLIDGLGGINSIDYSQDTGDVLVNLNSGASQLNRVENVTRIIGNGTTSTFKAVTDQNNTWDFYGSNTGEIDGIVFTDFNILEGGDLTDTFNFDGSSPQAATDPIVQTINLQINGNAGDDTLNITLSDAERGLINFDGGTFDTTSNFVSVDGGSTNYTTTYIPNVAANTDRLSYTSGLNTFTVNYTNADTVQDSSIANTLELTGTGVSDTFTLTDTTFNVTATTPGYVRPNDITYSGKTNITVIGGAGDILEIPAPLNNPGGNLTFDINTVNDNGNLITAAGLILRNTSNATVLTLNTEVDRLTADNIGDLFIIENDGINLTGVNTSNILNITADGAVFNSGNLTTTSQATLVINTTTGNIDLSSATNSLAGSLTLNAPGSVSVINNTATSIAGINSNSLNVNSTGAITQTGIITTGSTTLRSDSNITLALGNDLSSLDISNAVDVRVNDINALTIGNIAASGSVNITSNGLILGTISSSDITLNSGSGSIVGTGTNFDRNGTVVLTANGGISVDLAINGSLTATNSASGDIDVTKSGDLYLEDITNNNANGGFNLISNGGDVTIKKITLDYDNPNAEANFTFNQTGSIYGDQSTFPHIRANRAIFNMQLSGSVGRSNVEPIVTDVKDYIEVTGALGTYIRYLNGVFDGTFNGENEYKNIALQIIENLAGQQLIEVETLAEIDPAIFTDVRNYSNSDIALMMPSDQRYDISDEEEEDQEAKERRQKFLNSTP